MRSAAFTLFLALAALLSCGLAGWTHTRGSLDALFGAPPDAPGEKLYPNILPGEVKIIHLNSNGVRARFVQDGTTWRATQPWQDRMDPRAAHDIIAFTLGMRVEDVADFDEIDPKLSGTGDSAVGIRLEGAGEKPLAKYRLGKPTPWQAQVEGLERPVPTFFVWPRDEIRKRTIYSCAGDDITGHFKDGFKLLRDHRPFYFNPIALQQIRIRAEQGEFTLGRETPKSPWRVIKPLDLPTDPAAIKSLLEGLYELKANKISDRSAVTVPSVAKSGEISLVSFGSPAETTLEIFPPETPDAQETRAVVSDRPGTVFDLPLKPEAGVISLANLPLAVNEVRDRTLTHLNIASLQAIAIQPATGAEILVSREAPQPWMVTINGQTGQANEQRLFELLKAATAGRATGFESDAATDFTPWGLDRPFLNLRFLGQDEQVLELNFGMDGRGGIFANRLGTPTVMRVDRALIDAISVRPHEWRHARLWSLDRVDLMAIERTTATEPPLMMAYRFIDESWDAKQNDRDVTADLVTTRADFLLGALENLEVSRWLAPGDESAATALANPRLAFAVVDKTVDETGEFKGLRRRELKFAAAPVALYPGFFYGSLSSEPAPFLIERETIQKLTVELLEKR